MCGFGMKQKRLVSEKLVFGYAGTVRLVEKVYTVHILCNEYILYV